MRELKPYQKNILTDWIGTMVYEAKGLKSCRRASIVSGIGRRVADEAVSFSDQRLGKLLMLAFSAK
jgi:hypothetical protein